jgi:diguanylate cyclase (GGDEF)-like protein
MHVAVRATSALALVGAVSMLGLAALAPPTRLSPTLGWVVLACVAAVWTASAIAVRQSDDPTYRALLLYLHGGAGTLALLGLQIGPDSIASHLLIATATLSAILLPPRLAASVVIASGIAVALPLVHDTSRAAVASVVACEVLLISLAAASMVWTANVLGLRQALARERAHADHLARIDVLTGLGNRRAFQEAIDVEREMTRRTERPLSALVLDLDDFKQINDRAGHHEGDRILTGVAGVLRSEMRRPDVCFRWGGDEFVALLRDTSLPTAEGIARRVVDAVEQHTHEADGAPVRVSVGCAQLIGDESGESMLARADQALLDIKGTGRRVGVA